MVFCRALLSAGAKRHGSRITSSSGAGRQGSGPLRRTGERAPNWRQSSRARDCFSNDISNSRAKALLKNLELVGAGNICVSVRRLKNWPDILEGFFDKILVDAPCSGEGMFRRDGDMVKSYSQKARSITTVSSTKSFRKPSKSAARRYDALFNVYV